MKIEELKGDEKKNFETDFLFIKISTWYNDFVYGPSDNAKKQSVTNQRYKSAYVYFVGLCNPYLIDQLKTSVAGKFIEMYKEIGINYYPIERQVFSFKTAQTLSYFYQKTIDDKRKDHLESIAEQLASVCASLNEYPIIRYRK